MLWKRNEDEDYEGHFMIFEVKQDMFDSGHKDYEVLTPYMDKPHKLPIRINRLLMMLPVPLVVQL